MFKDFNKLWWVLAVFIILSPLGLIATGTAFGEWGTDQLQETLGFVPAGLARFANIWSHAILPDYSIAGISSTSGAIGSYILSAVVGVMLVVGIITLFSKLIKDEI